MSEPQAPLANSLTLKMKITGHHPSLAGHFPDNPVVPGVVILDNIMQLWQQASGQTINKIFNAKFVNLLRPDIACNIQYIPKTPKKIDFIVSTINEDPAVEKNAPATVICKGSFSYQ